MPSNRSQTPRRTVKRRRTRTTPLSHMGGYGVDGRRLVGLTAGLVLYGVATAAGATVLGQAAPGLDWLVFAMGFVLGFGLAVALLFLHRAAWTAVLSLPGTAAVLVGAQAGRTGLVVAGAVLWTVLTVVAGRRGFWRRRRGLVPWWDSLV
ncbi:hypothetical protein ABZ070_36295 [Streptomyces sp. NPDC006283]|uniref:hypothetical protein n=1 Tax=Streptomyces sp. NPDC006283 TaxID=3156741 RepID=UPI0033B79DD3